MTALHADAGGSTGTAGDGYRIPAPREPVTERLVDDPSEPGAHRIAALAQPADREPGS